FTSSAPASQKLRRSATFVKRCEPIRGSSPPTWSGSAPFSPTASRIESSTRSEKASSSGRCSRVTRWRWSDDGNLVIAGDRPQIGRRFETELGAAGHRALSAVSGEEALAPIQQEHLALIFLDVALFCKRNGDPDQ